MLNLIQISFCAALTLYLLSFLLYLWHARTKSIFSGKAAACIAILGWLANTTALGARTVISGRIPLSNGYEFLLTFIWITVILYIFFEFRTGIKAVGAPVLFIAGLLLGSIVVLMPEQHGIVSPLMPALKSGWLIIHVLTAVVAYSAFTLAAGLAVVYLWRTKTLPESQRTLDDQIYKIVALGFAMLTLAIVFGAIWAEQAWGNYWTWDPKETWSLITWIVYAVYLHIRTTKDWKGRSSASLVVAGFILVLFTFFGVNYLLSGLHSYG